MLDWSKQSNLVYKSKKAKTLDEYNLHNLGNPSTYVVTTSNETLERENNCKVLGIISFRFQKNTEKVRQKQPFRGVLSKRCSENMQQIYRRTPMPK